MYSLSGATRVLGILGYPVRHSLSPAIQNAAIAACELDYIYVPFEVAPEFLGVAVSGLRALGVCGFNVTIPHKTSIIGYLDELDESAAAAGAVNTVIVCDGLMIGYNTDGYGFVTSLADDLNFVPGADTIVVIGAGGAARGAVAALCSAGAERIVVVNRSFHKATQLAEEMNARYPKTTVSVSLQHKVSKHHLGTASLLVNTTSLGMNGERIDFVDLARLPKGAKVYDMVYSPAETLLLREASSMGIAVANGLGMLAAQGEKAFTIWTGKTPLIGLMKRVLQGVCFP
jgi:shikimate dehydrogenase